MNKKEKTKSDNNRKEKRIMKRVRAGCKGMKNIQITEETQKKQEDRPEQGVNTNGKARA